MDELGNKVCDVTVVACQRIWHGFGLEAVKEGNKQGARHSLREAYLHMILHARTHTRTHAHPHAHPHARTRTRTRTHAQTHTQSVTQAVVNMQRRLKRGPCVRWRFFFTQLREDAIKVPHLEFWADSQVSSQQILWTKNSNHLKLSIALGSEKSCYQWVASCQLFIYRGWQV